MTLYQRKPMLVKSFAAKTAASPATQRLHTPYAAALNDRLRIEDSALDCRFFHQM